jgi:hypothetical protein
VKKVIIIALSAILLLLSSCMQPTKAIVQTSVVTEIHTVQAIPTTIVNTITVVKVVDPISGNEYVIKQGEVGVANADACVNNYFNGLDAHWIGLVLNGDNVEHKFNVSVTPYNNPTKGILNSPTNVSDWVTVTNNSLINGILTVPSMSAASLYTTLNVPSGVQLPQEWGFLVNVWDANSGNYKTVDTVRLLVHMRQP